MPANNILPEARKNALITVIDEALEEVKSSRDVSLLQECRSIFRARVPLHLRAYVAANLALKSSPNLSAKNYSGHGKAKNKTGIEYSEVTFTAAGPLEPEAVTRAAEMKQVFQGMLADRITAPAAPDPAEAVNVDDFIDAEATAE